MKVNVNAIYSFAVSMLIGLAASATADAQAYVSTPVEISKEKVRVDGKLCYSHIVLERQTLYSISKAYGVSLEDIYKFNPSIRETGLKKNSIIIIPSQEALKEEGTAPEEKREEAVAAGQKTPQPETKPAEVSRKAKKEKAKRIHVAKWYEDLDVIAEMYGVTVDDIMKANNLKGRKLSKRQKLVIPYPEDLTAVTDENTAPVPAESPEDSTATAAALIGTATEEPVRPDTVAYTGKSKVNMSVILPLTSKEGEPNRNNMDFYCGLLLAVYDMAENGTGCNLNVYDIMNSDAMMSVESLNNSDIVIGPVSTADLTKVLHADTEVKAVVSPLDPRAEKLVAEHDRLVHIPTPHLTQHRDLVKWMEEDYTEGDRVLMITEKGARLNGITSNMREALDSSSLAYSHFSYSILEGRDVTTALTELMTTEGKNRVLIASESEAFVNDVIRNLNLLIFNNLDIALYTPSKTRGFETIEVENFHNTSMHISLTYYIDYDSPLVKEFLLKYRALFNTEPSQFAFHGYDVARFFIETISKYGDKWKDMLDSTDADMLQSTFAFSKSPIGGYVNNAVRRIKYDKGYSVTRVK